MFNIQKYLERFSRNLNSIDLHNKTILEIIDKNTGIKLNAEDIELKECVLLVKANPAIKNKLFIYKNRILEEVTASTKLKVIDLK